MLIRFNNFLSFFEAGLIPMFLIIGIWGGPRKIYSAYKFFLFTLLGSVLMLAAIIFIYWTLGLQITQKILLNKNSSRVSIFIMAGIF